jgi:hypothetical protein
LYYITGTYDNQTSSWTRKTIYAGNPLFLRLPGGPLICVFVCFCGKAHEDRVIDWDNVMAVPYIFSGISLEETLFWNHDIQLDSSLITLFRNKLSRLEYDNRNTSSWSNMLAQNSRKNAFLYSIITRYDITSRLFTDFYPELLV